MLKNVNNRHLHYIFTGENLTITLAILLPQHDQKNLFNQNKEDIQYIHFIYILYINIKIKIIFLIIV
jgi:hypothetical protein